MRAIVLAGFVAFAQSPASQPLRIVVLEEEDAVNLLQQWTAVRPLVEVRDRNGLPSQAQRAPAAAFRQRPSACDQRHVDVDIRTQSTAGTSTFTGSGTTTMPVTLQKLRGDTMRQCAGRLPHSSSR